jgi:hypothetical protein
VGGIGGGRGGVGGWGRRQDQSAGDGEVSDYNEMCIGSLRSFWCKNHWIWMCIGCIRDLLWRMGFFFF